jgi:hypothetical protein
LHSDFIECKYFLSSAYIFYNGDFAALQSSTSFNAFSHIMHVFMHSCALSRSIRPTLPTCHSSLRLNIICNTTPWRHTISFRKAETHAHADQRVFGDHGKAALVSR